NSVLQPVFSNLAKAIGKVSEFAAKMLDGLSKAPGMGWAKKAATDLQKVADKANATADGIKKIPSEKTVTIKYLEEGRSHLPTASGVQP
ncbi:hypothetical protein, partial [Streptococcus pneumoniae]|uniref:hypothetical protein n=1 Tax=Streptococcus pneumoniae TaxID=1313 RepID=UPI0018B023D3